MTVEIICTMPPQLAPANCVADRVAPVLGMSPAEQATTMGRTEGKADV